MSARTKGAIAVKLNPEALLAAARTNLAIQHSEYNVESLNNGPQPQMLLRVNRGEAAVINGEGVGEIATEDNNVAVYFTYGAMYITVDLTIEQVGHAATGTMIDIAAGIRTFGSRLDSNHYQWFRKFDPEK